VLNFDESDVRGWERAFVQRERDQRFYDGVARGGFGVGRGRGGTRGGRSSGKDEGDVTAASLEGRVEAPSGSGSAKRYRQACDLVCWTCEKRGHLSRECPEK